MGTWRRWDGVGSAATAHEHGLGAFRQSHRRRNPVTYRHARVAAIVAAGGGFVTRGVWFGPVAAIAVVAVGLVAYSYLVDLGDGGGFERPRRIAVHDDGLVLDPGTTAPGTLAWGDIVRSGTATVGTDDSGAPVRLVEVFSPDDRRRRSPRRDRPVHRPRGVDPCHREPGPAPPTRTGCRASPTTPSWPTSPAATASSGIHGTNEPDKIGTYLPLGTPVQILAQQ